MNYCECIISGFCEKHQCRKTKRDFELCQGIGVSKEASKAYRDAWDRGDTWAQKKAADPLDTFTQTSTNGVINPISGTQNSLEISLTIDNVPCEFRGELKESKGCSSCGEASTKGVYVCNSDHNESKECVLRNTPGKFSCQSCEFGSNLFKEAIKLKKLENSKLLKGPGKELIDIYIKAGVPSCQACKSLAQKMNRWGVDKCTRDIEHLVDEILPRAKKWVEDNKPWVNKLLPQVVSDIGIKAKIRSDLNKAIESARHNISEIERAYYNKKDTLNPQPFSTKPKAVLLFHLWPCSSSNWKRHSEYLKKYSNGYSRKIMSVATDENSASFEEVKDVFGDSWEYINVKNDPKAREVSSYKKLLKMAATEDKNTVIVCAHGKGAQPHTSDSENITWWTEAMYKTVVGNLEEIYELMEKGYNIVGSFRRFGGHFGCKHKYHYSGTFYALRASGFFLSEGCVPKIKDRWWGTESLPGDTIHKVKSACIIGDDCGDLYHRENQPRKELEEWEETSKNKMQRSFQC